MQAKIGKRTISILLVALLNVALVIGVVFSVFSAFYNSEEVSFNQNIENVRTLTNASANKVELEFMHHTQELTRITSYVNSYQGEGMTEEELCSYFQALYGTENAYIWQLVDNVVENAGTSKESFAAIGLCDTKAQPFSYRVESYQELAKLFAVAAEDNLGEIHYTSEFTDSSPTLAKSAALSATVRIRTADGYQYKTLMYLLGSDYINELISNNNEIDTWNFFDYSNIIIDDQGDYVISDSYFQGVNFTDYIALYNESFTKEDAAALCEKLTQEDYSDVLYYQNNKEQDCAYTIVPVQNSEWHILSIVPLSSFHNTYDFTNDFMKFAIVIVAMFAMDLVVVLFVNQRLRLLTRKAREASESKSQFLSSMSHDIRTPMNAIIGTTVIAEKQLETEEIDREALKESIKTIELSGTHLLTLVNDILDISKIESGKMVLSPKDFSITDTIEKMIEMCQAEIKEKKFDFKLQIRNVNHAYITGDSLRVNQIFVNILSNAIKYTEPEGKITVELSEEPIPGELNKARYIYKVSDTGIGMTPEFVDTIFERFTRAVDTRINAVRGTGLGMAIVKQIVTIMGGSIAVESELNAGSVFTVTLDFPIAQHNLEEKENTTEKVTGKANFADMKVLVAEDNDINWKVLNKILGYYNINADRAENGRIAVDKVQSAEVCYDLVLMDIQMPMMNGYEAAGKIRGLDEKKRAKVPIYAMTADVFTEDIKKCEEAGMNGHFSKPIEVEKVVALLEKICQEKYMAGK